MAIVLSGAFAKARALELRSFDVFCSSAFAAIPIWAIKKRETDREDGEVLSVIFGSALIKSRASARAYVSFESDVCRRSVRRSVSTRWAVSQMILHEVYRLARIEKVGSNRMAGDEHGGGQGRERRVA
jgi:hypothetical protein